MVRFTRAPLAESEAAARSIVDVTKLTPGTAYGFQFRGPNGELSNRIELRTPSQQLGQGSLVLAVASCYFPSDQFLGNAGVAAAILKQRGVTVTFLCGDQIYGDVPAGGPDLPVLYSGRYSAAWQRSRLGGVIERAATFFTCDDHEYWNNYPEAAKWLSRSWGGWFGPRWSGQWRSPAPRTGVTRGLEFSGRVFRRRSDPSGLGRRPLGEVNVFVADGRTDRTDRNGKRRPGVRRPASPCRRTSSPFSIGSDEPPVIDPRSTAADTRPRQQRGCVPE
jgi:hypothetical protein